MAASEHGLPQHQFNQQQRQPRRDQPRKQLLELRVFADRRLGLFQLVNFRVNLPELFRVVRAIIFSAGLVRDFLQRVLVHVHRHIW